MKVVSDKDRRSNPRIPVTAKCWLERESLTLLGTVTNISHGGLFMRTPVSVAIGTSVDLSVTVGNEVISAKGHVAWTAPPECKPQSLGVGIGFADSIDVNTLLSRLQDNKEDDIL